MSATTTSTDRVFIFDTTLRDGEQAPGASMMLEQKMLVANALQQLRVDVIEAGFPAASPGDFESVRALARKLKGVTVCALARAQDNDIDKCWEAVKEAEKPRIHVFLATSPIHREFKLKMSREQVLRRAVDSVSRAKGYCSDVEFSAEDASRTEPEFLIEVVERVIDAGATVVNIPDTVGYAVPSEFGAIIAMLKERVRNIDRAMLSVHCHNDLGLAVANSLAAIRAGARQIECTVNGVGERAGNAALEEIVMAIKTRQDYTRAHTNVRTEELAMASRVVSRATGFLVQRNKAIVGENAFAHEAGIHQHGMMANSQTYEIMKPADVGARGTSLVLGKHSGRHSLRQRLENLGFAFDAAQLEAVFTRFKALADRKKEVFDSDLETLVEGVVANSGAPRWNLVSIHAVSGNSGNPTASVCLEMRDGRKREDAAIGDGPVDAAFKAIERITGTRVRLKSFQIRNMTPGEDAQGEVLIEVEHEGREYQGRGVSTDIVVGSAYAYLEVINRIAAQRPSKPDIDEQGVFCGAV
jgi:2-isopropylmalate synthase